MRSNAEQCGATGCKQVAAIVLHQLPQLLLLFLSLPIQSNQYFIYLFKTALSSFHVVDHAFGFQSLHCHIAKVTIHTRI